MEGNSDCRFCNKILQGHTQVIENTILYENDHFICVPALGCFVVGYVLLISKRHVISIKDFSHEEKMSLKGIIESVSSTKLFKTGYLLFEHGNSRNTSKASCISHFHFHLMPWQSSKIDNFFEDEDYPIIMCDKYDDWLIYDESESDKEYLMLSNGVNTYFYCANSFQSQYIRKVISKMVHLDGKWNWAIYPFNENIIETIRSFNKSWK